MTGTAAAGPKLLQKKERTDRGTHLGLSLSECGRGLLVCPENSSVPGTTYYVGSGQIQQQGFRFYKDSRASRALWG